MAGKKWEKVTWGLLLLVLAVLVTLAWPGEQRAGEPKADLRAYLPALVGTTYHFAGSGMEFAAFSRRITFAGEGLLQLEDLSGTNLAMVVEHGPHELKAIYAEEEFYEERSLLDEAARRERELGREVELIWLQAPLKVGHSWSDENFTREIAAVNQVVEVPLGVFHDVVVVKSLSRAAPETVLYEYYAKNVGLIKREFLLDVGGEPYAVVSSLEGLGSPANRW
ncbi:MAG TPA: hypothetical protein PKX69_00615 [Limnochordia bacterium]|jgi:hypothetical protein|nr:hypothetical protein [Limnochordia bacterium]HOL99360.1 hypothetical protein [Limnochordia bacterium]HPP71941.1 hypothetical protein [Limnochordia bacterium]